MKNAIVSTAVLLDDAARFAGGLFTLIGFGFVLWVMIVYRTHVQVGIKSADSKFVTVFNQIDPEAEAKETVQAVFEQQERDRKKGRYEN